MKKLIKIGIVMSLMVTSMSAFAQNTGKSEYPRYGFWSNWSVGASFAINDQAYMGGFSFGDNWRKSTNIGMDIFAQQKLNHAFDWRIRFGFPSFWKPLIGKEGCEMDRHLSLTLDILWSINNSLLGYDPDRRLNLYLFAGGGLGFSANPEKVDALGNHESGSVIDFEYVGITLTGGAGASYRFGEPHHIFVEYGYDINGDAPKISYFFSDKLHHTNRIFRFGYYYCFGITATDQAVAAQKAMLTQENFTAMNTKVNILENQVKVDKSNEKKLENRIAELEDQLAQALSQTNKGGNSAAADSLQAVIDQIKADQLTFYAMPFSVLYDIDDWKVSETEEAKVKAIARVLKDNSDVKILVVGFADYSGSDKYNMKLSEKRANEVKRLLVKRYGIAEDRIQTDYKGKSVAFGDIQYALNRRVSFYRVIE